MRVFTTRAVTLLSALFILCGAMATPASAQIQGLERVGPTSPTNGFPLWFQDKTGVALEFCSPINALELDGGWCLLLPGNTTAPETFPSPFANEHFYWAADASLPVSAALPGGAKLVLGLEGGFATGAVISGDQITFARIRFVFDAPAAGTYTIYHPFGTDTATAAAAGERIFVTEDIGLNCATGFDCALHGRIGPFLLASNTPGGPELPAIPGPVPGKLYIADPARLGPVTGSPVNQNFFRITGPGGIDVISSDFTLQGRLFTGTAGGRVTVDRASFARNAGSVTGKVDVFATGFSTTQPRLPGQGLIGSVTPVLSFYPAACAVGAGGVLAAPAGVAAVPMFRSGSRYYGQFLGAIPASVCVQDSTAKDPAGQTISSFVQARVVDVITITKAEYNPASGGSLTVIAWSSDQNVKPALSASLGGAMTNLADGTATVVATAIVVPPAKVAVTSVAGGRADLDVNTLIGQPQIPLVPVANNDAFTILEDSLPSTFNVLVNDTVGGVLISDPTTVTVTMVSLPTLGTATVTGGAIVYRPNLNAFGTDSILYTVTNAAGVSDVAVVTITITNVNDPPVAVDDLGLTGVGNLPFTMNLLANDTDPDGAADLTGPTAGVNILTARNDATGATVPFTVTGGVLTFTAAAGNYTFTYRARDINGLLSVNTATVKVALAGGETLLITRADFIANKRRWRIDGTSSVSAPNETVFISYADGVFADGTSAVGFLVASTTVTAGLFTVDMTLAGANDPRNPAGTAFRVRPTLLKAISSVGGSSPTTLITIR